MEQYGGVAKIYSCGKCTQNQLFIHASLRHQTRCECALEMHFRLMPLPGSEAGLGDVFIVNRGC